MKPNLKILLLSLLFPTGVLWGLYGYLNGSEAHEVLIHPDIEAIDRRLDTTQPDIILVGSSLANKSVDEELMAKEMGLAPNKVQKIWSGMATIPAITLMIENRIVQRDLKPKAIVVLSPPNWLVTSQILQNANFAMHQTGPLSQDLAHSIGDSVETPPTTLQQQKIQFQDGYTDLNQHLFGEVLLNRSPDEIDEQLEAVFDFDQQRTDGIAGQQLIQHNIREIDDNSQPPTNTTQVDYKLLTYLARILHDANIHLIVVTLPVSEMVKNAHVLPTDVLEQMVQRLEKQDARLLDYFEWSEPNIFADTKHMNKRGQRLFTKKLVPELQKIGILNDTLGESIAPQSLSTPSLQWSHSTELLPINGSLTLTFPRELTNTSLTLCASGKEETTLFDVPNTHFDIERTDTIWCEKGVIKNIQKNQRIVLSNPTNSPIHIHSLEFGDLELIEQPRYILSKRDWTVDSANNAPSYGVQSNKRLGKWLQKKQDDHPNLQVGTLKKYTGLTDVPLLKQGISNNCRPVNIEQNGDLVTISACKEVWKLNQGVCLHKDQVLNITDTPVDWSTYSVSLAQNRGCKFTYPRAGFGWWIYPGDTSSTHFNWPKGDYSKVYIEGQSMGQGPWSVMVYSDDQTYLKYSTDTALDLALELPLNIVLPAKTPNIRVAFNVPDNSNRYLFVHKVQIQN